MPDQSKPLSQNRFETLKVRFNSPGSAALLTAAAFGLFIMLRLAWHAFDPSVFIVAGDLLCNPHQTPAAISVLTDSDGYDGQFYYRLSLNPFTTRKTDFGVTLVPPAYRQQRILYPLLVWIFSGGGIIGVPLQMIVVNFVALVWIGWLGAKFSQSVHRHAWWGLLFPLYPGFILSLSRNLTEILQTALLLSALYFLQNTKKWLPSILITAAVLTRETALLLPVASGLLFLKARRHPEADPLVRWHFFCLPAAIFLAWQAILFLIWHQFPIAGGTPNLGYPLNGIVAFFRNTFPPRTPAQALYLVEFLFLAVVGACVLQSYRRSNALQLAKTSFLLYGILMLLLTDVFWREDYGFMRAFTEFYILGFTVILGSDSKTIYFVAPATLIIWLALFAARIYYL